MERAREGLERVLGFLALLGHGSRSKAVASIIIRQANEQEIKPILDEAFATLSV